MSVDDALFTLLLPLPAEPTRLDVELFQALRNLDCFTELGISSEIRSKYRQLKPSQMKYLPNEPFGEDEDLLPRSFRKTLKALKKSRDPPPSDNDESPDETSSEQSGTGSSIGSESFDDRDGILNIFRRVATTVLDLAKKSDAQSQTHSESLVFAEKMISKMEGTKDRNSPFVMTSHAVMSMSKEQRQLMRHVCGSDPEGVIRHKEKEVEKPEQSSFLSFIPTALSILSSISVLKDTTKPTPIPVEPSHNDSDDEAKEILIQKLRDQQRIIVRQSQEINALKTELRTITFSIIISTIKSSCSPFNPTKKLGLGERDTYELFLSRPGVGFAEGTRSYRSTRQSTRTQIKHSSTDLSLIKPPGQHAAHSRDKQRFSQPSGFNQTLADFGIRGTPLIVKSVFQLQQQEHLSMIELLTKRRFLVVQSSLSPTKKKPHLDSYQSFIHSFQKIAKSFPGRCRPSSPLHIPHLTPPPSYHILLSTSVFSKEGKVKREEHSSFLKTDSPLHHSLVIEPVFTSLSQNACSIIGGLSTFILLLVPSSVSSISRLSQKTPSNDQFKVFLSRSSELQRSNLLSVMVRFFHSLSDSILRSSTEIFVEPGSCLAAHLSAQVIAGLCSVYLVYPDQETSIERNYSKRSQRTDIPSDIPTPSIHPQFSNLSELLSKRTFVQCCFTLLALSLPFPLPGFPLSVWLPSEQELLDGRKSITSKERRGMVIGSNEQNDFCLNCRSVLDIFSALDDELNWLPLLLSLSQIASLGVIAQSHTQTQTHAFADRNETKLIISLIESALYPYRSLLDSVPSNEHQDSFQFHSTFFPLNSIAIHLSMPILHMQILSSSNRTFNRHILQLISDSLRFYDDVSTVIHSFSILSLISNDPFGDDSSEEEIIDCIRLLPTIASRIVHILSRSPLLSQLSKTDDKSPPLKTSQDKYSSYQNDVDSDVPRSLNSHHRPKQNDEAVSKPITVFAASTLFFPPPSLADSLHILSSGLSALSAIVSVSQNLQQRNSDATTLTSIVPSDVMTIYAQSILVTLPLLFPKPLSRQNSSPTNEPDAFHPSLLFFPASPLDHSVREQAGHCIESALDSIFVILQNVEIGYISSKIHLVPSLLQSFLSLPESSPLRTTLLALLCTVTTPPFDRVSTTTISESSFHFGLDSLHVWEQSCLDLFNERSISTLISVSRSSTFIELGLILTVLRNVIIFRTVLHAELVDFTQPNYVGSRTQKESHKSEDDPGHDSLAIFFPHRNTAHLPYPLSEIHQLISEGMLEDVIGKKRHILIHTLHSILTHTSIHWNETLDSINLPFEQLSHLHPAFFTPFNPDRHPVTTTSIPQPVTFLTHVHSVTCECLSLLINPSSVLSNGFVPPLLSPIFRDDRSVDECMKMIVFRSSATILNQAIGGASLDCYNHLFLTSYTSLESLSLAEVISSINDPQASQVSFITQTRDERHSEQSFPIIFADSAQSTRIPHPSFLSLPFFSPASFSDTSLLRFESQAFTTHPATFLPQRGYYPSKTPSSVRNHRSFSIIVTNPLLLDLSIPEAEDISAMESHYISSHQTELSLYQIVSNLITTMNHQLVTLFSLQNPSSTNPMDEQASSSVDTVADSLRQLFLFCSSLIQLSYTTQDIPPDGLKTRKQLNLDPNTSPFIVFLDVLTSQDSSFQPFRLDHISVTILSIVSAILHAASMLFQTHQLFSLSAFSFVALLLFPYHDDDSMKRVSVRTHYVTHSSSQIKFALTILKDRQLIDTLSNMCSSDQLEWISSYIKHQTPAHIPFYNPFTQYVSTIHLHHNQDHFQRQEQTQLLLDTRHTSRALLSLLVIAHIQANLIHLTAPIIQHSLLTVVNPSIPIDNVFPPKRGAYFLDQDSFFRTLSSLQLLTKTSLAISLFDPFKWVSSSGQEHTDATHAFPCTCAPKVVNHHPLLPCSSIHTHLDQLLQEQGFETRPTKQTLPVTQRTAKYTNFSSNAVPFTLLTVATGSSSVICPSFVLTCIHTVAAGSFVHLAATPHLLISFFYLDPHTFVQKCRLHSSILLKQKQKDVDDLIELTHRISNDYSFTPSPRTIYHYQRHPLTFISPDKSIDATQYHGHTDREKAITRSRLLYRERRYTMTDRFDSEVIECWMKMEEYPSFFPREHDPALNAIQPIIIQDFKLPEHITSDHPAAQDADLLFTVVELLSTPAILIPSVLSSILAFIETLSTCDASLLDYLSSQTPFIKHFLIPIFHFVAINGHFESLQSIADFTLHAFCNSSAFRALDLKHGSQATKLDQKRQSFVEFVYGMPMDTKSGNKDDKKGDIFSNKNRLLMLVILDSLRRVRNAGSVTEALRHTLKRREAKIQNKTDSKGDHMGQPEKKTNIDEIKLTWNNRLVDPTASFDQIPYTELNLPTSPADLAGISGSIQSDSGSTFQLKPPTSFPSSLSKIRDWEFDLFSFITERDRRVRSSPPTAQAPTIPFTSIVDVEHTLVSLLSLLSTASQVPASQATLDIVSTGLNSICDTLEFIPSLLFSLHHQSKEDKEPLARMKNQDPPQFEPKLAVFTNPPQQHYANRPPPHILFPSKSAQTRIEKALTRASKVIGDPYDSFFLNEAGNIEEDVKSFRLLRKLEATGLEYIKTLRFFVLDLHTNYSKDGDITSVFNVTDRGRIIPNQSLEAALMAMARWIRAESERTHALRWIQPAFTKQLVYFLEKKYKDIWTRSSVTTVESKQSSEFRRKIVRLRPVLIELFEKTLHPSILISNSEECALCVCHGLSTFPATHSMFVSSDLVRVVSLMLRDSGRIVVRSRTDSTLSSFPAIIQSTLHALNHAGSTIHFLLQGSSTMTISQRLTGSGSHFPVTAETSDLISQIRRDVINSSPIIIHSLAIYGAIVLSCPSDFFLDSEAYRDRPRSEFPVSPILHTVCMLSSSIPARETPTGFALSFVEILRQWMVDEDDFNERGLPHLQPLQAQAQHLMYSPLLSSLLDASHSLCCRYEDNKGTKQSKIQTTSDQVLLSLTPLKTFLKLIASHSYPFLEQSCSQEAQRLLDQANIINEKTLKHLKRRQ
ncbi:hypothetical protein BLNAU_363 [Blattamonas nauphoetae]|uniref:Uncharacterized protein n=1 Tax=Blattamonas nauphoetae TaxID=2049346 RepID=A0ABQ9YL27_9EUKA|nr:hypothetical protein BLNAU_363 [Blattamonas nauphoetae]